VVVAIDAYRTLNHNHGMNFQLPIANCQSTTDHKSKIIDVRSCGSRSNPDQAIRADRR
jgi:hypothetical protein